MLDLLILILLSLPIEGRRGANELVLGIEAH